MAAAALVRPAALFSSAAAMAAASDLSASHTVKSAPQFIFDELEDQVAIRDATAKAAHKRREALEQQAARRALHRA